MTWGALAGAAVSVLGGLMGKDSADDGLAAQEAGAARSDATQRYMYDTTRADNAPTMQRGNAAGSRLGYLMGLGTDGGSGGGSPGSAAPLDRNALRNQLLSQYTKTAAGAGAAAPTYLGGSMWVIDGKVMSTGSAEALGYTRDSNQPIYGGESGNQVLDYQLTGPQATSMIDEAGLSAAIEARMARQSAENAAASSDPAYGSLMRNFSEAAPEMRKFGASDLAGDLVYQNGLQFGLDEGRKGIERQQQATGGLLSGATLKALSRFGNDYGTTKTAGAYGRFDNEQQQGYGRYMDRRNMFNTDRDSTFNKLSTIAGSGQVATNQVGAAGLNYANRVSNTAEGMGNAIAAAGIAGSNAISGGLRGAYDNYQTNRLIDRMRGGSGIKYSGTSYNPYAPNYENSFDRM